MPSESSIPFGNRAGRVLLQALAKAGLVKSDEWLAAELRDADAKASDTLLSLQRKGDRSMTLDFALAVAVATSPTFFVEWVARRLAVPITIGRTAVAPASDPLRAGVELCSEAADVPRVLMMEMAAGRLQTQAGRDRMRQEIREARALLDGLEASLDADAGRVS